MKFKTSSRTLVLERKTGKEINVSQIGLTEGGGGGVHFGQNGQKLHENYKIGIFVEEGETDQIFWYWEVSLPDWLK